MAILIVKRLLSDFTITSMSAFAAGRAVGGVSGPPIKSFSSPYLITGAKTAGAFNTAVVSQGVQLNLTNSYFALKAAFDSYVTNLKTQNTKQSNK
jgi:hypothetical protein